MYLVGQLKIQYTTTIYPLTSILHMILYLMSLQPSLLRMTPIFLRIFSQHSTLNWWDRGGGGLGWWGGWRFPLQACLISRPRRIQVVCTVGDPSKLHRIASRNLENPWLGKKMSPAACKRGYLSLELCTTPWPLSRILQIPIFPIILILW